MQKSFKRELIIGISVIAGSILAFLLVSGYMTNNLSVLADNIAASRFLLAKRAELLENLADIKKSSSEATLYKQKMDALLPTQEQLLNLPQILNGLASAHGVSFSFSFRGTPTLPQGGSPGSIIFAMDSSGSLDALLLFLNDIEPKATRSILSLDNFDLTKVDQGYHLVAQGRAFFQ